MEAQWEFHTHTLPFQYRFQQFRLETVSRVKVLFTTKTASVDTAKEVTEAMARDEGIYALVMYINVCVYVCCMNVRTCGYSSFEVRRCCP